MSKHYPVEQRERAVKMVLDHLDEYRSVYAACRAIGPKVGVGAESLRRWVLQAQVDASARPGVTTVEQERIRDLEREVRDLKEANEILKGGLDFLRAGARPAPPLICGFIDEMRARNFRVESVCRVLTEHGVQVAPRTYRSWKSSMPSARTVSDAHLTDALRATVGTPEGMYGRRKMTAYLRRQGHRVAGCTVDRLMRDEGLSGVIRGRKHRTTIAAAGRVSPGAGSARSRLHRGRAEPQVGHRLHLYPNLDGVRLCGVRRRLLLTGDRGLACHHR